jgi:hypothetical protein
LKIIATFCILDAYYCGEWVIKDVAEKQDFHHKMKQIN